MADKKVNIGIGYTLDKSGLEEMQSYFQRIANKAAEPSNKLNDGLRQAGKTAKTLDSILEKTFNTNLGTLNVTKFNQELQKSGLTMKKVKADLTAVGNQGVTAYNRLSQAILGTNTQLKQSSKLLDSMFTTFKNTVRYGISSSIFNNFTNSVQKAYEYTKKLDSSLNDIRIVTGKSAQEMDRFAEKANNAAKSLGASTLDMTQASLIYYQQGLSDAEVEARAETTVKVANVTKQKADEVSEQLTAVWNGYKVTAAETESYIDKLAAVAATTASDLEELSIGMSKVASAAASMGVNFDDLTAQISTIVSVTRQAPESVGTALKTIYARIGDLKVDGVDEFGTKLGEVSSQLEVMGINILDQEGNMRDMSSIMAEVAEKWQYWTEAQKQAAAVAIAGKRQYNNLIALFENWDMYSDALDTAKNAMGTLQKQQDIYMESTQAKLTKLRATWQDLYKSIGDTKTINGFIDGIRDLVEVFTNFSDSFGGGLKSIIAFGAIIVNIFSKQISQGINNTIQRMTVLKNNAEQLRQQATIRETQGAALGPDANAGDIAVTEGLKIQAEYSEKIYQARAGLNEEQIQTLTNQQKELGLLTEQISLADHSLQVMEEKGIVAEEDAQGLKNYNTTLEEVVSKYSEIRTSMLDAAEAFKDSMTGYSKEEQNLESILAFIQESTQIITKEDLQNIEGLKEQKQVLDQIIKTYQKRLKAGETEITDAEELSNVHKEIKQTISEITRLYGKGAEQIKKQSDAASIYNKKLEERDNKVRQKNNIQQEADAVLELGKNGQKVGQIVTGITSTLGSLAMAWSSTTSLMKTWGDETVSLGDKITQTVFTMSMVTPTLISSWTKLNEVFGTSGGIIDILKAKYNSFNLSKIASTKATEAEAAANFLNIKGISTETVLTNEEIEAKIANISAKQLDSVITNENNVGLVAYNLTKIKSVDLDEASKEALYSKIIALAAEKKATDAAAASQNILNKSILAFPGFWFVAAAAAVAASIAMCVKAYKNYNEAQLKNAEATLKTNQKKQDEINANKELYDSYNKLYLQYQETGEGKEELAKITDQLAEKYQLEGVELAKLTGNYEKLTEQIKQARLEELKGSVKDTISSEWAASMKVMEAAKNAGNVTTLVGGNGYHAFSTKQLGVTANGESDDAFITALKSNSTHVKTQDYYDDKGQKISTGYSLGVTNVEDPQEMLELYQEIQKTIQETKGTIAEQSEGYKEALKVLEALEESMTEYEQIEETKKQNNFETGWLTIDIDRIDKDYDLYQEKIKQLGNVFRLNTKNEAEAEKELRKYLAQSTNDYVKFVSNLEFIAKDAKFDAKTLVESLSDDQLEYAMSGKINFSEFINYDTDQVLEIFKTKMHQIDEEDLTTVVSLRAKITSDKKLTKKEIEESLDEQSQLLKDERYAADFADFDNKSSLEQLELLNNIIADKINLNKKWEQSVKEVYSTMIEQEKIYQEKLEKRRDELNQALSQAKTNEQIKALQLELARVNAEIDQSNQKIVEFEKNMSQVQLNEVRFDNLIAGIDGVIDEVKTLKGLTDAIGEGWVVAADKLETFAKNFPELMADQKNYNYLQDGSLHLTEEGQEAFKAQLEARKQEIILQNESYQRELQITADKKLAEYEYYKNMADHLEKYIKGYENQAELEGNLKKGLEEYKVRLMNATGVKDEELNKIIQENNNKTADNTIDNVHNMFNAYQQLGAAMLACQTGAPVPNWSDNRASAPKVDTVGHELTFDVDFLEPKLSKEDAEKMAKMAREAADLAYNEYSTAISKKVAADGQTNALLASLDNLGARKKGKDKKQEEFDDEFDKYYDIKKAIDLVNNALDRLSKIQEKLHGKELIQSLKNENNLIKQQAQNYETLYAQQKVELDEIQGSLMNFGAEFDDNGFLTNYASLTASALEQYQSEIDKYNAGLITEEAKDAYEKSYEKMKKYLDRYDSLFYNEMKDTQDKLDEYNRQTMENNLKIWETEIQIKLDTSQAERDWMDFLKEINNDFRKVYKNLNIEMDHFVAKMETYSGMNTIETDLQAIKDVMVEIDKINSGKTSSMFESVSDAQEKLKELDQQLETDAKDMKQLWQDAWDAYLEGIDQSNDKLEFMNDRFEKINEELEFQGRLIELLYGEEAYSLMNKLYKSQEVAAQNNISSIKAQADLWHQLWVESGATLQNQADWTSDQEKYYENWQEQQSKLNDLVTSYIELLQKDYLNTVNDVLAQLEKAMTGGNTLEDVKDQWDKITAYSDKYYDGIEHALEVQKFANKIDADIAKTVGIKNQQKLEAIREKEITYLREKKNLTKYDMEAAEARYQIALKEIALEEAQQNKTSMKLVRNEEGNWAYQYMADADDVAQKQDDLLTSYGDLYRLAGDAYQNNLEEMQSLEEQYLESQRKIYEDLYMSDEEKTQRLVELGEWYQETMNRLAEENELYRQDLRVAGAGTLLQVYNQDQEAYEFMTTAEQAMLDSLIGASISSYQELEVRCAENYNHIQEASAHAMTLIREDWTSSAQQIADTWAADDGQSVMSQVTWAQEQIGQAALDYQTLVDECASQVERDFGPDGVSGSINEAAQETHDLQDAIAELCDTSKTQLDSLKKTLGQVELAWMAQKNKVSEAIEEVKRYIAIIGKANQVAAKSYGVTDGTGSLGDFEDFGTKQTDDERGGDTSLPELEAGPWALMGRDHRIGNQPAIIFHNGGKGFKSEDKEKIESNYHFKDEKTLEDLHLVPLAFISEILSGKDSLKHYEAYRSGGYTGEWGEDGRLAVLHQKELVLNANDTANFLNGISLLRDMVSLNGSIEKSIAAAIGGMAMQLGGMSASKISTGNSQAAPALAGDTYYVTADFPNANNAEEIKQAILNLPNIVSQALGKDNI